MVTKSARQIRGVDPTPVPLRESESRSREVPDLAGYGQRRALLCDTRLVYITHSFVGTTIGRFRYLFFALYEDYNDFGHAFVREFNVSLERLARDLKDKGAVIQPFLPPH